MHVIWLQVGPLVKLRDWVLVPVLATCNDRVSPLQLCDVYLLRGTLLSRSQLADDATAKRNYTTRKWHVLLLRQGWRGYVIVRSVILSVSRTTHECVNGRRLKVMKFLVLISMWIFAFLNTGRYEFLWHTVVRRIWSICIWPNALRVW